MPIAQQSRDFLKKAVDFRAKKKNEICDNPIKNYICGNLWIKKSARLQDNACGL